jgi:hypothetical protein
MEGLGYYCSFTLRISPQAPDGRRYPIVDGGFTDWTARLLGNRKERLLISGIGSEFVCKTYRSDSSSAPAPTSQRPRSGCWRVRSRLLNPDPDNVHMVDDPGVGPRPGGLAATCQIPTNAGASRRAGLWWATFLEAESALLV